MAGEGVTEAGLGGGPISERGSGEMESVSELSRLSRASIPLNRLPRASSNKSDTSFGGIKEETVAFRFPGLTMGDWRMRTGAAERGAPLLLPLSFLPDCSSEAKADSSSMSMSILTGDAPAELPEVAGYWGRGCGWPCAVNAGDVKGLKYAPGTVVMSRERKWTSWGVTAGETSGVKVFDVLISPSHKSEFLD